MFINNVSWKTPINSIITETWPLDKNDRVEYGDNTVNRYCSPLLSLYTHTLFQILFFLLEIHFSGPLFLKCKFSNKLNECTHLLPAILTMQAEHFRGLDHIGSTWLTTSIVAHRHCTEMLKHFWKHIFGLLFLIQVDFVHCFLVSPVQRAVWDCK